MGLRKYKVIITKTQYQEYCNRLETLVLSGSKDQATKDEIDLLTLWIQKWDLDHNTFDDRNPVELLRSLMAEHNMKTKDLAELLGITNNCAFQVLTYKHRLSKEMILKLADHFSISQGAFTHAYDLINKNRSKSSG